MVCANVIVQVVIPGGKWLRKCKDNPDISMRWVILRRLPATRPVCNLGLKLTEM
jgi:hypothetical protein